MVQGRFTGVLLCSLIILVGLCKTQGGQKQIGDYKIPVDPLNDNYCQKVDISKFRDLTTIDSFYSSFVGKKLDKLKEPVRKLIEKADFVRNANVPFSHL